MAKQPDNRNNIKVKSPATVEAQIEKLRSRGCVIDDEDFAKEIEAKFLDELSEKFATRYIPFLILTGKRNDVEDIIERYYKASYTELLEYTKKTWDGDKYPKSSKTFMCAAGSLGRYLKVGDKRIKEILFDIADLYEYADFPVIPTYQNPLFQLLMLMKFFKEVIIGITD
jgi:hypothetical protein